ncbi:MAG TPA: NUDIX domain-containing protein [Bacteroidales bacterium]|nr:NUDIX domain-containing protein [Bacteroidales bacterium]HPF03390.1 NUDIX domain-containing protein [Bacteroidales bacterium]HPJ59559.1 NUDIX domain-containing protein [Bacteroidales bacterium]HPR13611.1 NUDIX domain-containing protein [Bacteroidales bacterium]HRW84700.1 NUDIX domain-containing protein [Bacteroidales bacterium]
MYKVHFEDRFILISPEPDRLQKYGLFHKFHDTSALYGLISDFQSDKSIPSINVYGPNIRHIWKIFRIFFTEVGAAGGLVMHSSGRYLFIEKKGKLDLPKGHIEPGEEAETCAMREVSEECGIQGHRIVMALEPSYHTYSWEGISYLKKTNWFLMHYTGPMIREPQEKEGITRVEWLLPEEISNIRSSAWLSLMDLINVSILRP